MLYLAIDLHRKQMTINLRGEDGEPILRRQVSTWGPDPRTFLADVQRRAGEDGFVAIHSEEADAAYHSHHAPY